MGIETPAEFRAALREFIGLQEQAEAPSKVKQLERAMIGRRNDGMDFFPTPESVADEMVAAAGIEPGMRVLEPSAGWGHIAERIRAAEVEPDVVEISGDRRELLEAKGFNVVGTDFIAITEGGYDRILMNPPFSDGRDIQHVQHAYTLLKPGGRIVAIMGESAFTNQSKRATEFRAWLEQVGGTEEKLAEGSFNDPGLPVNTGANARMVVIERSLHGADSAPAFSRNAQEAQTLKALSENDELFALPKSEASTVEEITAENDPAIKVKKTLDATGRTDYQLTLPNGKTANLIVRPFNPYATEEVPTLYGYDLADGEMINLVKERPGTNPEDVGEVDDVWLDASNLESGGFGAVLYNIAATYAHNTGRKFIGDPAGLSDDALRRRTEQMLSSALKFGTTEHLAPHPRQARGDKSLGIPPLEWTYGDDLGNIKALAETSLANYTDVNPVTFEPSTGRYLDSEGVELDDDAISLVASAGPGRESGAGVTTLKRNAVLAALVREESSTGGEGGRRNGLLEKLLVLAGQSPASTRKLFYSRGNPASGDASSLEARAATAEVERIVQGITSRWANAPEVVVAFDMDDTRIPERVRIEDQKQRSDGATGAPEGFYLGQKVYILASQVSTQQDVARVLFHESLGHFGLRGHFGGQLKPILQQLAALRRAEVSAKAKQYGLDMADESQRLQAAEEVLAEMAQIRPEIGYVKRAIAIIRTWMRRNIPGFKNMALTDADIINNYILPARGFVERGQQADGVSAMVPAFSREDGAAPDSAKFKKWFGDSKVVDDAGKPLVVYHGTGASFDKFGKGRGAIYFTPDAAAASAFAESAEVYSVEAERYIDSAPNVVPVYLSIKNPRILNELWAQEHLDGDGERDWTLLDMYLDDFKKEGYDGAIMKGVVDFSGPGNQRAYDQYIAFEPEQIKSAIGNNGDFDPENADVRFSRSLPDTLAGAMNSAREVQLPAGYMVNDFFQGDGRLSWWHKSVGTQYNLAQRSAPFKKVFDGVQDFINDVSFYASEAADLAPSILPKMESWKDITKSPISAADNKAIAAPIFEGTLTWMRDGAGKPVAASVMEEAAVKMSVDDKAQRLFREDKISQGVLKMWQGLPIEQYENLINNKYDREFLKPGIVFTPAELKSLFKLTDAQVALYGEFRAAVDQSLTNMAVADMVRYGGADVAAVRDQALAMGDVDAAAALLRDHLMELSEGSERAGVLMDSADTMITKADRARDLMDRGYAPLSRFGSYSLDVVDENGERVYFGLFESKAEANRMARQMKGNFPTATIQQGTMSDEEYKLFAGVSPETLELFGEMLGLEAGGEDAGNQVFQQYLKLAKANRSAMKRLIQRKGIAGFSEDPGRVLAGFVYSNARQTSSGLHMGDIAESVKDIPKGQGELKDAAVRLMDYAKNPMEEAQAIRGLLFAQYLGGSVASALVNLMQPLNVTFPWLSQHGGVIKAAGQMKAALADSLAFYVSKKHTGDMLLDAALKKAEEDGIVSPQEVFQLMSQAQGKATLKPGDGTALGNATASTQNLISRGALVWGKVFGAAEQFNRRTTFIAAYRTAVEQGMTDPAKFAERAVNETQFIYNKGAKPRWARGAVGGVLFTFKSYAINYVELLSRMASSGPEGRKAALLALAVLFMMSGAEGLPFSEDLDDVVDGVLQRLGYNFSSKQAKKEFFTGLLGRPGAEFVERGVSGLAGVPIDVSGRLGMGNLLPGTGLLTKKPDHSRDLLELVGPGGDFAKRIFEGAGKLVDGNVVGRTGAVATVMPTAVRNAIQAWDMYTTGMYRDTKGKKVIDTDAYDVLAKAVGFQPNDVARVQDATRQVQIMVSQNKIRESEIADQWAQGVFEGDKNKVQEARDAIARWNENNPTAKIRIAMPQIIKRLKAMREDKETRIARTAPKEIRASVRRELADTQ